MTLNVVIAPFGFISPNSIALPIKSQWLKIDLYCAQNTIFHLWPKLTHPAARSLYDS